jgi:hypothetical protein
MKDEYSGSWTDDSATTVTLFGDGTNVVKRVYEYGGVGPIELWTIQKSIDGIVAEIKWTKIEEASNKSVDSEQEIARRLVLRDSSRIMADIGEVDMDRSAIPTAIKRKIYDN